MRLTGQHNVSIDAKGRVSIPAPFRDELRQNGAVEGVVVTQNKGGGLVAYTPDHWDRLCDAVMSMPAGEARDHHLRFRIAPAQECSFNAQGRIQVPQNLRKFAGLEKDAVVVGMFEKVEIWSQQAHDAITAKSEAFLIENPQLEADLGF